MFVLAPHMDMPTTSAQYTHKAAGREKALPPGKQA